MKSVIKPRGLILLCGLLATAVLAVTLVIVQQQRRQQIEAHYLQRFMETGAVATATVARIAEQYLDAPQRNQIELFNLSETVSDLAGSRGLTVTGSGVEAPRNLEYIWASSDSRYRAADGSLRYDPGRTRILDELSSEIGRIIAAVNQDAALELAELGPQIEEVTRSIVRLLTRDRAADEAELAEMDDVFRVLYRRGRQQLAQVTSRHAGALPAVEGGSLAELGDDVLFYHPVAVFDRGNGAWYAGMIRFRRSAQPLYDQQLRQQRHQARLTLQTGAIALVALWAALALVWALMQHKPLEVIRCRKKP